MINRRQTHTSLVVAGLFTAFFILRLPFRSRFLVNWDAVQLALGTGAFDLHRHQPHPPGYIGYVALGRLLNAVTADPNSSLTLISALGGGLAPAALFVLARRFLPAPYPLVAALLFGTSPLLWYYSEVALTYAAEAALVVPLVWACHHARSERSVRHLLVASVLLALLGSMRQSALALLLPLWLYTAARFEWSRRLWAVSLLGLTTLLWAVPLLWLAGGPTRYLREGLALTQVIAGHTSVLAGNLPGLGHNVALVLVGTLVGVHFGLGVILLAHLKGAGALSNLGRGDRIFFLLWALPALLTYLLGHTGQVGYMLLLLPIWFLWLASALAGPLRAPLDRGRHLSTVPARRAAVVGLLLLSNVVGFLVLPEWVYDATQPGLTEAGGSGAASPSAWQGARPAVDALTPESAGERQAEPPPVAQNLVGARQYALRRNDDYWQALTDFVRHQDEQSTALLARVGGPLDGTFRHLGYYLPEYRVYGLGQDQRDTFGLLSTSHGGTSDYGIESLRAARQRLVMPAEVTQMIIPDGEIADLLDDALRRYAVTLADGSSATVVPLAPSTALQFIADDGRVRIVRRRTRGRSRWRSSAPALPRVAEGVVLFLPALALAWLGWQRRWVTEDAFIILRIVRHLLDGHGPVFNVGERVEANTSALWVGLLAAAGVVARPFSPESLPLEWIATASGLLCAALGLWAATVAAARSVDHGGARGLLLPTGAFVVVALAPYWDFATSGLETGLIFAWLGLSALAVARLSDKSGGGSGQESPWPAAVLVGLGPLVRPDLAIPAAALFAVLLVLKARSVRHALALGAAAAALPLAYQVFRMGYFAALVPNTAIAKEGGAARWGQGLQYLLDFGGPYWLWLPLVVLGREWLLVLVPLLRARRWRGVALLALPPIGGLAHALYVVRVGGDFMHGRMLLPSLFALLLPVMATAIRRPARAPLTRLTPWALVPWALVCALWLRPPYHQLGNGVGPQGIADERWFYVRLSGSPHPVTLADYDHATWKRTGDALRLLAERERVVLPWPPDELDVLQEQQQRLLAEHERVALPWPPDVLDVLQEEQRRLPPGDWVPARVVFSVKNIGLLGYAAGPRVHIVDQLGLADPIAARIKLDSRGRPGHEKALPGEWVVARFSAPEALPRAALTPDSQRRVRDARAALQCGPLPDLLHAVEGPLGWQEVARNLRTSARLTAIRLPADPSEARGVLCGPAS